MIQKLSHRIFLIILITLTTILWGMILLFAIFNYNNTIHTATSMLDRFIGMEKRRGLERPEGERILPDIEMDGVYWFQVENGRIVSNEEKDKKLEVYALQVSKKQQDSGIIGKYIYQVRRIKGNTMSIMLMENEEAIFRARMILVSSAIVAIFSFGVVYLLAKKVSKVIVQPVEGTFEKQKQFISDASHELKTPLAVMEANVDVLASEVGDNKWMGYIQSEIDSMNTLINDLLLLAKTENVSSKEEYQKFDASQETAITVAMFESMAYEKKVILKSKIEEAVSFYGNVEDLQHILSTLLDNAIHHTKEQGEVEVTLTKEKNELIWKVQNQGEEIPEAEREKIFERFYRVDKARNRKEKRYGLGLAIAKSIVEKYAGNISVDCKEGKTTFQVQIPIEKG